MELTQGIHGTACAPRLDERPPLSPASVPVRSAPSTGDGILAALPYLSGFERTSADEIAILSILRVLHMADEPRTLSGVEQAFVTAGRVLFAELSGVCDRMLEQTRAAKSAPLNPPPRPRTKRKPSDEEN